MCSANASSKDGIVTDILIDAGNTPRKDMHNYLPNVYGQEIYLKILVSGLSFYIKILKTSITITLCHYYKLISIDYKQTHTLNIYIKKK